MGPFFESQTDFSSRPSFCGVRPFWSRSFDSATQTHRTDVLWPIFSYRSRQERGWWRAFLLAWGERQEDVSNATLFPFWFSTHARTGDEHWGLFPFWGTHPHVLLMNDWHFVCWPFYHTYTVKGVRTHTVLWPFISWREDPRAAWRVWPLYGEAHNRADDARFALWPFFVWSTYAEDRDTSGAGSSFMFFPLYGEVRRARENQTLLLPPFISWVRTPTTTRGRYPWPFFEYEQSRIRARLSIWPLWEQIENRSYTSPSTTESRTWRVGWQLVEKQISDTPTSHEERVSLFPFWTRERCWTKDEQGLWSETSSYMRIWPFWSSTTEKGRTSSRALDLIPIRHAEGIERNWSAFWTLWEHTECDVDHTKGTHEIH